MIHQSILFLSWKDLIWCWKSFKIHVTSFKRGFKLHFGEATIKRIFKKCNLLQFFFHTRYFFFLGGGSPIACACLIMMLSILSQFQVCDINPYYICLEVINARKKPMVFLNKMICVWLAQHLLPLNLPKHANPTMSSKINK